MPEIVPPATAKVAQAVKQTRVMNSLASRIYASSVDSPEALATYLTALETSASHIEAAEKETGQEKIDEGAENVILKVPSFTERRRLVAAALEPISPERAREIFYTHRIMRILFPHNFPRFTAAWGTKRADGFSGTVRMEVLVEQDKDVRYPFTEVLQTVRDLNLPIKFETLRCNYKIGDDGGEYYVDTMFNLGNLWDEKRIVDYMDDKSRHPGHVYSKDDKKQVIHAIERLRVNATDRRM